MVRRRAVRLGSAVGGVLLCLACVEDTPSLFIVHNSALDENCAPIIRGNPIEFQGTGTMDLTVASTYTMFPKVENLMAPSGSVTLGRGGGGATGGNNQYEGNRVTLRSAAVSFRAPAGFDVALPRNLSLPLSGTLEPNGEIVTDLPVVNFALGNQLRSSAQLRDRGASVPVVVEVKFHGVSTSGTDVESNTLTYPLTLCRGCLLTFPPDADDPAEPGPDCRGGFGEGSELSEFALSCFPGQNAPLDCRVCRAIVTSSGADDSQVERACEPRPSAGL
jgi:hypothetical protein